MASNSPKASLSIGCHAPALASACTDTGKVIRGDTKGPDFSNATITNNKVNSIGSNPTNSNTQGNNNASNNNNSNNASNNNNSNNDTLNFNTDIGNVSGNIGNIGNVTGNSVNIGSGNSFSS